MFPYTFETVTTITLTVIGIILVLYFVVLKRKGWLRENSKESFYRCPNQECKKIFEKPIELKDLSEKLARVYPACPHCGLDLGPALASGGKKRLRIGVKIPLIPKKPEKPLEARARALKPETVRFIEALPEEPLELVDAQNPQTAPQKSSEARPLEWAPVFDEVQETSTSPLEPGEDSTVPVRAPPEPPSPGEEKLEKPAPHVEAEEVPEGRPLECSHFFGYLRRLPKSAQIPDECYGCRRMVECFVQHFL